MSDIERSANVIAGMFTIACLVGMLTYGWLMFFVWIFGLGLMKWFVDFLTGGQKGRRKRRRRRRR